jgi:TolB-like protein
MLAVAVAVIVGGSGAFAAPTTAPSAPGRSAGAAGRADEDPRPRVLVLPFEELSDGAGATREWLGKALQRSLVAELTRSGLVAVMTPPADAPPAKDAAAAAKLARDVHAPLAILASYQVVDQNLRVTGQMIESINGEHIAAIKADGSLRDLFAIEDAIGNQVRRDLQVIMQPEGATRPAESRPGAPGDPFQVQPNGPVQQRPPTGAYDGSDLQRSLGGNRWAPPEPTWEADRRNSVRYGYPTPPYYPGYGFHDVYDYYDWCGYGYGPTVIGRVVIGNTRLPPNNNYATSPGQMGRSSGGNHITGPPGQMGRPNGGNTITGPPGQMGRSSGGNQLTGPPGQARGTGGAKTK